MGPEACSIPMFLLAIRFLVFANSMSVLTLKNITTVNDENELSVHKKKKIEAAFYFCFPRMAWYEN